MLEHVADGAAARPQALNCWYETDTSLAELADIGDGEIDSYRFTHVVLMHAARADGVDILTTTGPRPHAKHVTYTSARAYLGRPNPDAALFSFDRARRRR